MANDPEVTLKIRVLNVQGEFVRGTVNVEIWHRTLSDHVLYRGLPASGEITISGLRRAPAGDHRVTVTLTDVFKSQSQFINIPASGFAELTFKIDRGEAKGPNPVVIEQPFIVHGQVIDLVSRRGVAVLRIEAWDKELIVKAPVGSAATDENGYFRIELSQSRFKELFANRQPEFFFKVFRDGALVKSNGESVLWNVTSKDNQIVIEVDLRTEEPRSFVVRGQVLRSDKQPLVGVIVQAMHADAAETVFLNSAETNIDGRYEISYSLEKLVRLGKKRANLFVQVQDPNQELLVTSAVHPDAGPLETIDLVVKPKEIPKDKFAVQGHVRGVNGNPLAGLVVRAFDRDLPSLKRNETLGEVVTDAKGFYRIEYTAEKLSRAEKDTADLQVRIYAPNILIDYTKPLAESETRFNARPNETIDLVLTAKQYRGPSEWERLMAAVTPLVEGVPVADLTAEDIDFLGGETGEDGKHLALLAHAHRLAKRADISAAVFYGWFRMGMPSDWEALRLERISTLRKTLLDAIDQNIAPDGLRADIEKTLARIPNPEVDEFVKLPGMAALPPDKRQAVLIHADGIDAVSDQVLAKLVEQNTLTMREAQSVGLGVTLHRLAGGEQSLIFQMLNSEFGSVKTRNLRQARDLAMLESEDWEKALEQSGSPVPTGVAPAEYARSLAMDAVSKFPETAFVQRATQVPEGISAKIETIQSLLAKNAKAVGLDFDALDLAGVNDSDKAKLRAAHAELKRFANLHPGLDLHAVLSAKDDAGNALKVVNQRVGWLRTVFDLNQDVNFLTLDHLPDSADFKEVKFGDLAEEARGRVLQDLRAHQRIYSVTNNAIPAREVMQAGFHSASAIALTRLSDFAAKTGIGETEATAYYANARELGNEAATNLFRINEVATAQVMTPVRAIPTNSEFFKRLNGFQDLIDNQPWCACAHCQSVLSPAAYFVDLMYYVEENILRNSFVGQERHVLHLKMRRRDLWELELTCKNTNDYVPYLVVVNEVLESYIKDTVPLAASVSVYEHLAEEEGSFSQPFTLPIERLEILLGHFGLTRYDIAKAIGSNRMVQVRARLKISAKEYELIVQERTDPTFLGHLFKTKLEIVIPTLPNAFFNPIAMQTILSATGLDHETVASVFKTKFVNDDGSGNPMVEVILGKLKPDDVQNNSELAHHLTPRRMDRIHRFVRLWRKLPWTVEELDYVLIRVTRPGNVSDINDEALGKIFDLLDLNAKWSLPIDELMALSDRFPERALRGPASLFDRLFNQSPFLNPNDRWPPKTEFRFTHPAWAETPVGGVSSPDNNTLSRLLAGLQLADKELVELIASLLDIPAIDYHPATPDPPSNQSIELSKNSIGILYRHARLMRLLKRTMTDFIKLIALTPRITGRPTPERYLDDLEDIASVIEFAAWQQESGFSLDEIDYMTGGPRPAESPDPVKLVSEVTARVKSERSLEFADTVFTQIGFTDIESRRIVSDNLGPTKAFAALADGLSYRLNAGFVPVPAPRLTAQKLEFADTVFTQIGLTVGQSRTVVSDNLGPTKAFLIVPPGGNYRIKVGFILDPAPRLLDSLTALSTAERDKYNALAVELLRKYDELAPELLGNYDAMRALDVALGGVLNLSPDEVKLLREFAAPLSDIEAVLRAIQGAGDHRDRSQLADLIGQTLRYHPLFKSETFDTIGRRFVRDNPKVFGLSSDPSTRTITTEVVRNVAAYVSLVTPTDAGFTTASDPPDINAIQTALMDLSNASPRDLAKTLRTDESRITALKPHLIGLPPNPFDALRVLGRCLAFTEQMGVSGETLSLIIRDGAANFIALSRAAEDVFGAFRAKYPNEKTFGEKIEPFEDQLRARKRDALVDFIVSKWPVRFADPNKLYEYFLIDVMQGGCARTSRVVAAISSLQLYVQRVLMHLEWSSDYVPGTRGVYAHFHDSNKQAEWYWREHYRVWEANRKVFLYPENYIEPELRDDKTPLFKELEDTLLQQEISEASVHDAYAKYLTGFDEVARLKIAGAYYDSGINPERDDALHLFGVTQDTPPVYYYRVINKTLAPAPRISAWQKLELQIPVRKISPIVFEGRLYVFWLETTTRPQMNFVGGGSVFEGYRHAARVRYSTLRLNGAWDSPQSLSFSDGITTSESRIIDDPKFQTLPDLPRQLEAARVRVAELTAKRDRASEEVARTIQAVADAEAALARPLTFEEGAAAAAVWLLVSAAANSAFLAALAVAPPEVASATGAAAGLAVLVASVPGATVPRLRAAGVLFTDPSQTAQRKLALRDARESRDIARNSLLAASRELFTAQVALARLQAMRNVISVRWDRSMRDHSEPRENYTPEGWEWDRVYPEVYSPPDASEPKRIRLMLVPRNDPVPTVGVFQLITSDDVDLTARVLRELSATESITSREIRINNYHGDLQLLNSASPSYGGQEFYLASFWLNYLSETGHVVAIAPPDADLQIVNGKPLSVMVQSKGYPVWMRKEGERALWGARLGTTITPSLINLFSHEDASGLLKAEFQEELTEHPPNISPVQGQGDIRRWSPFDLTNPYLTYFRETFFHIPFLVANHLNSQQKFAETQRWYHYIFNPTTADGLPWRYREFNDPLMNHSSLREMLTHRLALEAYRADPFNPHAIARTRLSAYQKSIIMKYIDNLLDWGDSLFNQFTMESLNEATMLYVMAQEILGPKPPALGSCGEGSVTPKNYKTIRPRLNTASDFLIELEVGRPASGRDRPTLKGEATMLVSQPGRDKQATIYAAGSQLPVPANNWQPTASKVNPAELVGAAGPSFRTEASGQYWTNVGGTALKDVYALQSGSGGSKIPGPESGAANISGREAGNIDVIKREAGIAGGQIGVPGGDKVKWYDQIPPLDVKSMARYILPPGSPVTESTNPGLGHPQPIDLVPPKAVFCIPPNKDLLAYWSRVEDRLFKIRNCMDIAGVRRRPELFAAEIDPRLLVRMKAAGLTLDDVLNSISGNVPPYRFSYLIEKAKQYAGTLQSFGSQLLSALEKRDGEELANLRSVHEHNLLTMRTRMTQLEIDAAEDTIEGLRRQKSGVEYRQDHFRSLSDVGSIAAERTQQQHQRQASEFRTLASVSQFVAAVLSIIPDVGAPTAMKFGGSQLGAAGRSLADGLNAIASFNEMAASMAAIESSNQRRDQEWKHQIETAKRDVSQIEKQITAAEIRRDIAVHSLKVHQQTIDQSEEIFEFFRNEKFTNINLYRLLSNRLQGLYRQAFNSVLSMAKMTEQAFATERTDVDTRLSGDYWDTESAGLLAGERLLIDLQSLERQYIENNYRQIEVEQSFSLAQFAPEALALLRRTGECPFAVPEWFFDLFYPGQYRRRLKVVRLTIPCVTGPYTNVAATLRLNSSKIRLNPLDPLTPVPLRHTVSMAASKAQYDSGVFDFSFRDERYMPFEGAGAISDDWQLSLPKTIRVFDYDTISDVILHLSYTAEFDGLLEERLDGEAQRLLNLLKIDGAATDQKPPMTRVFSLRQEFPDVFHRLSTSALNTEIAFTIEPRHFPFFLMGRTLKAKNAKLLVISKLDRLGPRPHTTGPRTVLAIRRKVDPLPLPRELTAPDFEFDGQGLRQFDFGNVLQQRPTDPSGIIPAVVGDYLIMLRNAGPLAPVSPRADGGAIDPPNLHDIIIEVGYGLD